MRSDPAKAESERKARASNPAAAFHPALAASEEPAERSALRRLHSAA
jgi:hypothetical protein